MNKLFNAYCFVKWLTSKLFNKIKKLLNLYYKEVNNEPMQTLVVTIFSQIVGSFLMIFIFGVVFDVPRSILLPIIMISNIIAFIGYIATVLITEYHAFERERKRK